jgi:hypothetical protein
VLFRSASGSNASTRALSCAKSSALSPRRLAQKTSGTSARILSPGAIARIATQPSPRPGSARTASAWLAGCQLLQGAKVQHVRPSERFIRRASEGASATHTCSVEDSISSQRKRSHSVQRRGHSLTHRRSVVRHVWGSSTFNRSEPDAPGGPSSNIGEMTGASTDTHIKRYLVSRNKVR